MTQPVYVIPDIHGHADKLRRALMGIEAEGGPNAKVVCLGDLVDRGPDSCGVIDIFVKGIAKGRDWTVVRGNHDQLFLDFLTGSGPNWQEFCARFLSENMGGEATLASYGLDATGPDPDCERLRKSIPEMHRHFLASLPYFHATDDLFFCHAGVRPGVPLDQQSPEDLFRIREPFLSDPRDHGKLIVHGHTPVDWPKHHGNRVALDGGAGWGRALHVAVFEGRQAWLLTQKGRVPLTP